MSSPVSFWPRCVCVSTPHMSGGHCGPRRTEWRAFWQALVARVSGGRSPGFPQATITDTLGPKAEEQQDSQESEDDAQEQPRKSPRTEAAGSSEAPPPVASTHGERRRTMRCCTVVRKNSPSEKFTLVMDPKQKLHRPVVSSIFVSRWLKHRPE